MKKIIPITALILSMTATGANAQIIINQNKMDINTGILTVTGVADAANSMISINIPKAGVTPADLQAGGDTGSSIAYSAQVKSGSNGEFTFEIDLGGADEGIYEVYVGGDAEDKASSTKTSYMSLTSYEDLIEILNSEAKAGEEKFYAVFDTNEDKLFMYSDVEVLNKDAAKKILYNFANESGFSETDSVFNMSVYKAALAAQLIQDERVSDAEVLLGDIYVPEEGIMAEHETVSDFKAYIDTDEKREYFAKKFNACSSLADFDKEFANALLLTVVKYPDNVTNLQDVFEKYSEYLDADTDKANLKDYSSISGKEYSDIDDCVKTFNKAVNGKSNSGGSSGGGGGSSSGGSGFGLVVPGSPEVKNEKIEIKFEDLNSVPWAYNAVSELFERKIISGRSETRFAPTDKITREEFAKLLVEMSGVEVDKSSNAFSDVADDAWYAGYVNTAYKLGFCNGAGEGLFGTGREITRQDMCVMAYNALKTLGHEIPSAELGFADVASFAEYAKTPVAALSAAGIVNGVGDNNFNPTGNASRAEAAVIIYKVLTYIE